MRLCGGKRGGKQRRGKKSGENKTGSRAAFPFPFRSCLGAGLREVREGACFPGDFQPHFADAKSSSVEVNVKMSIRLSASLVETLHLLPLPSSAPRARKRSKNAKGEPLGFSCPLLPPRSAAKSLRPHLGRSSSWRGQHPGELSHTCERVGRVWRPRSLCWR